MQTKSKDKSVFFCKNCGYESPKWMGQCPGCREWNTFSEEPVVKIQKKSGSATQNTPLRPLHLSEIVTEDEERFDPGFEEFKRVLGGGIVPGSLVLVGGDPGIGKSTLLLQTSVFVSEQGRKVLYISGEESLRQIKLRAGRTGGSEENLTFLSAINIDEITDVMVREKPDLCIIDSIQTMYSEDVQSTAGSVTQVRECAQKLMVTAKTENIACFIVGHVTKEGTVAGPRVLEHIVDTVLYFESGDNGAYRILRSAKNRFGSTNEIGVFEMADKGLREVPNPSEYMLSGRPENATGACVTCLLEGTRPMLLEVQGLVTETQFNLARRQALGLDYMRLNLLLAVLEKRGGIHIGGYDAYINVAGGMKITEPACDLSVIAVILSSYRNKVIPSDTVIFGEVGLSGEVRAVPMAKERVKEAVKLGFRRIIIPALNLKTVGTNEFPDIEIEGVKYISELFAIL